MQIISREDAIKVGAAKYFTGLPCKHGHISERRVHGRICVDCSKISGKKYRSVNAEKRASYCAEWREKNEERVCAYRKERWAEVSFIESQKRKADRAANPTKSLEYGREWRKKNKDRIRLQAKKSRERNRATFVAATRRYKAAKLNRTPAWLTGEDITLMRQMYRLAQQLTAETSIKHHVDHIIPLRGKNVSGLHVPSNLRVITAEENSRKSNSFIGL